MTLNVKQTALAVGLTAALFHALWAVAVAAGFASQLLKWKMANHFVIVEAGIAQFSWMTALIAVIMCFVAGAVLGGVFAAIWNWVGKKV